MIEKEEGLLSRKEGRQNVRIKRMKMILKIIPDTPEDIQRTRINPRPRNNPQLSLGEPCWGRPLLRHGSAQRLNSAIIPQSCGSFNLTFLNINIISRFIDDLLKKYKPGTALFYLCSVQHFILFSVQQNYFTNPKYSAESSSLKDFQNSRARQGKQ